MIFLLQNGHVFMEEMADDHSPATSLRQIDYYGALDTLLSAWGIDAGSYTLLDLKIEGIVHSRLTLHGKVFQVSAPVAGDLKGLSEDIFRAFQPWCRPAVTAATLTTEIIDSRNIDVYNGLFENKALGISENVSAEMNFSKHPRFFELFTPELTFAIYFETLCTSLLQFLRPYHTANTGVILCSPLARYRSFERSFRSCPASSPSFYTAALPMVDPREAVPLEVTSFWQLAEANSHLTVVADEKERRLDLSAVARVLSSSPITVKGTPRYKYQIRLQASSTRDVYARVKNWDGKECICQLVV